MLPAEHLPAVPKVGCRAARAPGWSVVSSEPVSSLAVLSQRRCSWPAQDDTPEPTNRAVYLHDTPSATFFVSQYGGFGQDDITVSLKVARPSCEPAAALPCCAVCSACACCLIILSQHAA